MLLEGFWKVLRESKAVSDGFSLVQLSRMLYKGSKGVFKIDLPEEQIIKAYAEQKPATDTAYEDITWHKHFNYVSKESINWEDIKTISLGKKQEKSQYLPNMQASRNIQINNPMNIILFRHFICLLIHAAILQSQY